MKIFARIVLLVVVLVVVAGEVVYQQPVWVGDQRVHFAMWREGERSHVVTLPEGRIRYFEEAAKSNGDGTPLLLIHGLGGRSEDFANLMPQFAAQGFHVYALDLLGYGQSDKPADSDFSITTEEHVVMGFMDAVHLPHAYIGAWSMGGWIALKLALDVPQRVDRIAVYDSVGIVFETAADTSLFAPTDGAGVARLIRTMSPTMAVPPPFVRRDIIRRLAKQRWVIDRSITAMRTARDVVDARLAGMQPPLLLVYGAEDVLTPPSVGATMHQLDPRSVFATVEGCGHFLPIECSATTAKVTVEFFKAQPAMSGGELKLSR
jgi:pimeloyl-ACP methyl ester carboxylesterase